MASSLLSGGCSGLGNVFGKLLLNLVSTTGADITSNSSFWICAPATIFVMGFTVYNQNINLSYFSQLLVVPVFLCCLILGTLCGGIFVMGEYKFYTTQEMYLIALGNSISIIGIIYKVSKLETNELEE